jgi:hypothetical protein
LESAYLSSESLRMMTQATEPRLAKFLDVAESLKPKLRTRLDKPVGMVEVEQSLQASMGWKAWVLSDNSISKTLIGKEHVIFDFGKRTKALHS